MKSKGDIGRCPTSARPKMVRSLAVEADGDRWKGDINPKIRLKGQWLAEAGFKPGSRVNVRCIAPGMIELRAYGSRGNRYASVVY